MKISIITATYNSATQIFSCIESVNSQTYTNIEHIIVDGASEDNTLDIIKNMPNRVVKIISEPDRGIYEALNKGIASSNGDVIGFLHADDIFASPHTIENIAQKFKTNHNHGTYGNLLYVHKKNTDIIIRHWKSKPFNPNSLILGWMPAHPTLFLKKEVYERKGLFDLQFLIAADYDFMLRVLKDRTLNIDYLPEVITKMRMGGASNKSIKNIIQKSKEDYLAIKKNQIGGWYTLIFKNFRKLGQFFLK